MKITTHTKSIIKAIIILLIILIMISGTLALEGVSKFGITDENQGWLIGQKGTAGYNTNWTDSASGNDMPLVSDLNGDGINEIIQNRAGQIRIYALNGTLIAFSSLSGLGNRQISVSNAQHCPRGVGLYTTFSDGEMAVRCLVNNTINPYWICLTPSNTSFVPDFTGATVSNESGHNLGVFYYNDSSLSPSHQVRFCDETNSSYWSYPMNDSISQTYFGVAPHGNLLNDGTEYYVFPYVNGANVGVFYINKNGANSTIIPISTGYVNDPTERAPIVIKRGAGSPDDLLIPHDVAGWPCYGSSFPLDRYWFGDATGFNYADFIPIQSELPYCTYTQYSNAVQLGTDGDICWSYSGNPASTFVCYASVSASLTYNSTMAGPNEQVSATDMNNDGFADFFFSRVSSFGGASGLCLYTGHSNNLTCTNLGFSSYYVYGVDADNDNKRDIISAGSSPTTFNVFLTNGTILSPPGNVSGTCTDTDAFVTPTTNFYEAGTVTTQQGNSTNLHMDTCHTNDILYEYYCSDFLQPVSHLISYDCSQEGKRCVDGYCQTPCGTPVCLSPCQMIDDFSYNCSVQTMGWNDLPYRPPIYPIGGQLCYNTSDQYDLQDFDKSIATSVFTEIATDEFDVTVPADFYFMHRLNYLDSTGQVQNIVYWLDITQYAGNLSIAYHTLNNGVDTPITFCFDCFATGVKTNIKIIHYNFDTKGRNFINRTTNQSQPILPHTITVIIDNNASKAYYNLPQYEPLILTHTNTVRDVYFSWGGDICIDNVKVYEGSTFNQSDIQNPGIINTTNVKGCWDTKTGKFQCWISDCQECCDMITHPNDPRVTDFGCVMRKTIGFELNKVKDWILDNIIIFILVLVMLILFIPILLRILEITRNFGGAGRR